MNMQQACVSVLVPHTGLYVPEEYGGSGLGRLDGALIFEGLSYGDVSTAAYLTIHNM